MDSKFYEIINKGNGSADMFLYGEIVSGDKWEETDMTITDFKKQLDSLDNNVKTLNIYCNSPGGSVFTAVNMSNLLERIKHRITINAYVDGIAASAASFLIMKAHHVYMYKDTFLMLHKPMIGLLFGANAIELREKAEWLDKVEKSTCIPAYMSKATPILTEEALNQILEEETWFTANEASEYFEIKVIDEVKDAVACIDEGLFNSYKNVPKKVLNKVKPEEKIINKQGSSKETELRQQIAEESKISEEYVKTILGGIYK